MEDWLKGRGSQIHIANDFDKTTVVQEQIEGLDEPLLNKRPPTTLFYEYPKKIVNKITSPDIGFEYSLNPYQGCEHGCVYCYARKTHEFWGFNAGLDFESKLIAKKNAALLLEKHILQKNWQPVPIILSGNTDCYQPIERKLKLTRQLLEVFLKYRHPVGIITKNSLIQRDLDILKELAKLNLVKVVLSITTLDDSLRRILEPRTASVSAKLHTIRTLSEAGVHVGVMNAPIIPCINHHEIPEVIKTVANLGAASVSYTIVRLNGKIGLLFEGWLEKYFPERKEKVLHHIKETHAGHLSDSRFGTRMQGEGAMAKSIKALHLMAKRKYLKPNVKMEWNTHLFRKGGNYSLF